MDNVLLRFIVKTLLSALIITGASELSRRSQFLGALLISLPLASILALTWLWMDTHDAAKVSAMSTSILWLVIPSLLLFVLLPLLLKNGFSFPLAMLLSCAGTAVAYIAFAFVLRKAGILV
jgi:hypothetical protein